MHTEHPREFCITDLKKFLNVLVGNTIYKTCVNLNLDTIYSPLTVLFGLWDHDVTHTHTHKNVF